MLSILLSRSMTKECGCRAFRGLPHDVFHDSTPQRPIPCATCLGAVTIVCSSCIGRGKTGGLVTKAPLKCVHHSLSGCRARVGFAFSVFMLVVDSGFHRGSSDA